MSRHRSLIVALAAIAVVATSTASASAAPDGAGSAERADSPRAAAASRAQSGAAEEYVVAFDQGADAGAAAVEAANGTVLDVNEEVGLALVSSTDGAFLEEVRSEEGVSGAARNHDVGTVRQGMPHRYASERPTTTERRAAADGSRTAARATRPGAGAEPLADRQWDMAMIGATPSGAHRTATGEGVDVGIIDTGVEGTHPDIAPNFDESRSRNFTMDIPEIDGACEVSTCIDPAGADDNGHGTHVAGEVAAPRNRFGIGGVAPDATLVNLRAGQDSGYFFLYETVAALTEAGNLGLDVVNMSFYTDPWLYNCASRADYVSGDVTDEEIAEQAFIRQQVLAAVTYAHERGVTLVGAAGNGHTDLAAPTRSDATSPDYPPETAHERVVTNNCLDLPGEAPEVIGVSAVGPSGTKSDFSNYGLGEVEISAPGGWFRDFVGTPDFQTPENMVLGPYPLHVAIEEGLADENGEPVDDFSVKYCDRRGTCGFYTYLNGTSMAAPHVTGVAALAIEAHGRHTRGDVSLAPDRVGQLLARTATDHACPAGGVEIYTDEGRTPDWNAACQGTTANNGLYGEGIVSATGAVR
jgi:lantibiotic leader peptide-processing serine protease